MFTSLYCNSLTHYSRLLTREVKIGDVPLGAHHPIRVQSMTTTDTMDTNATVEQSIRMIDAGCELESYAADITRTFPVAGKFSAAQRDVYELVLAAQSACIKAVKPGNPFGKYHDVAVKVLAQGLIDLKLCKGSLASVIETES